MCWPILVFIPSQTHQIRADYDSSTCTFMTGKSVTCIGACANEIMPKAKEGRHVRIVEKTYVVWSEEKIKVKYTKKWSNQQHWLTFVYIFWNQLNATMSAISLNVELSKNCIYYDSVNNLVLPRTINRFVLLTPLYW